MNLFFPKYAFHPLILLGAEGKVAESMRRFSISFFQKVDSATPGKPSVQNDMIGCCSGLVIGSHEHDDPNLTLLTGTSPQGGGFPSLFETVDSATSCRMTADEGG